MVCAEHLQNLFSPPPGWDYHVLHAFRKGLVLLQVWGLRAPVYEASRRIGLPARIHLRRLLLRVGTKNAAADRGPCGMPSPKLLLPLDRQPFPVSRALSSVLPFPRTLLKPFPCVGRAAPTLPQIRFKGKQAVNRGAEPLSPGGRPSLSATG